MESKQNEATLVVAVTVMMGGFIGLCSRRLQEFGFGPEETSFVRSLITVVGLAALILFLDRSRFKLKLRDIPAFAVFGIFKLLSDLLLFAAQDRIPLGLATLLQMTAPFYVLVLSCYLFKEKITFRKILAMFGAFFGLMLVCDVVTDADSMSYFGTMCGIASGFFFALHMIGDKVTIDRGYDPLTVMLYVFLFSLVFNLPMSDVCTVVSAFAVPEALGYILFLGLLLTLMPFTADAWAMKYMPPSLVAILGTLEAVAAMVVGMVFFGETLSALNLAGMTIVILSVVLLNVRLSRRFKLSRSVSSDDVKKD